MIRSSRMLQRINYYKKYGHFNRRRVTATPPHCARSNSLQIGMTAI
jgi:hypothetical protein